MYPAGITQLVEYVLSKHKVLGSIPSFGLLENIYQVPFFRFPAPRCVFAVRIPFCAQSPSTSLFLLELFDPFSSRGHNVVLPLFTHSRSDSLVVLFQLGWAARYRKDRSGPSKALSRPQEPMPLKALQHLRASFLPIHGDPTRQKPLCVKQGSAELTQWCSHTTRPDRGPCLQARAVARASVASK